MAERYVSALTGPEMDEALLDMAQHNSEAWAVGTRNGTAVSSSDDTYQNNSKYYADEAKAAAARAEAAVPAGTEGAVLFSQAQSLTDAQKVQARENISAGEGATNPNLLDNPFFTVNQRGWATGSGPASGNVYCVDRWRLAGASITATANSDSTLTIAKANGAASSIMQRVSFTPDNNAIYTVSVMDDSGNVYKATGRYGAINQTVSINSVSVRIIFATASSGPSVQLYMIAETAGTFTLKAIKLEIGRISTLVNDAPPNYAGELLKCQRYFLRVLRNGGYSVDVGFGAADSTTTARITIPTPVPMAKNPTVSMSGTVRIQGGGSGHEITNISNYQSITNVGVQIHPTTTGLTNGDNVILSLGSNGAYIDLSADF